MITHGRKGPRALSVRRHDIGACGTTWFNRDKTKTQTVGVKESKVAVLLLVAAAAVRVQYSGYY
eukprot:897746-Rhodomonas_salina.1